MCRIISCLTHAIQLQDVATATEAETNLQQLKVAVQKGHLDVHTHPNLKEYARFFESLSVIEGVLCRGDKVLIPEALQKQVIEIAHEPHQGITKTKQHVRASMWFLKMDSMIEERLNASHLCRR